MFVDLMHDIANTFTERFLKSQLVFDSPPAPQRPAYVPPALRDAEGAEPVESGSGSRTVKRYNAMGILEEVPAGESEPGTDVEDREMAAATVTDQGANQGANQGAKATVASAPRVVGAGRVKSIGAVAEALPQGWENTPRNSPCPCGSGKKFKKCHGANLA